MVNFILLSAAISTISITISKSVIFRKLRSYLGWRVLKCPYCLSHWVAFLIATLISFTLFDFIINSFALVAFASVFSLLILIFIEKADNMES